MSSHPTKPDIELLPDTVWKSIERKVFTELDHEEQGPFRVAGMEVRDAGPGWLSRRLILGVAASAAAAALLWFAVGRGASDKTGDARTSDMAYVETSDSSTMLVVDGSSITVSPHSRLWYTDAPTGVTILLDTGRVECAVRPQPEDSTFEVRAGNVVIEVVGTRFAVQRAGDAVDVSVSEGVVKVLHQGREVDLVRGATWSSVAALADGPFTGRKGEFYRALALETHDPQKAKAFYIELARGDDMWAANALYAHARLSATLGQTSDARRLAGEYLARFPRGANRGDVAELLVEIEQPSAPANP